MHASCSAFTVTEFYDSQIVQEAEILNKSTALLGRTTALGQSPIDSQKANTTEE